MATWRRGNDRHSRYWEDPEDSGELHEEASKDFDRILYSTAFRRLGGVTQVVASNELGLFHNRLTHTLKTTQVGSRITNHLRWTYLMSPRLKADEKKRWAELVDASGGLESRIVRAACMAHDLGHPPFGHIGEDELQIVTSNRYNATNRRRSDGEVGRHPGVPQGYGLDDSFEGNAQSLRIVTKLAFREPYKDDERICPALNLTKGTLTALMKYPWSCKTRPTTVPSYKHLKKWNYYDCEGKIAQWALDDKPYPDGRTAPPLDGKTATMEFRTLEAQVMDWADDISYAVHDVEDFFRAGVIPLDDLADSEVKWSDFFEYAWGKERGVAKKLGPHRKSEIKALLEPVRQDLFPKTPYVGSRSDRENLHKFASSLIKNATGGTRLHESGTIAIDLEQRAVIEILKQLTWYYVIDRPSLESVQRGQRYVIRSLFRDLIGWVEETWDGPRLAQKRRSAQTSPSKHEVPGSIKLRQLPARLVDYLDIAFSEDEATGCLTYEEPARISRAVVDYIVSLTEAQALELCHRLTGRSARSMMDGWVYG